MYKTYATKSSEVEPVWFVVDASGLTLGRLATRIAVILRGKHKPMFSPSLDTGDFVVVINAEKVFVTGDRLDQKKYYRHSLYLGGLKEITLRRLLETHTFVILLVTHVNNPRTNYTGIAVGCCAACGCSPPQ